MRCASMLPYAIALGAGGALAGDAPPPADEPSSSIETVWDFDAYYSSVGANIPLTDEPVPEGGKLSEREVYQKLFLDSLHPRVLLLEASVYPMPIIGTYLKAEHPSIYDAFTIGNTDLNLMEGLTAGFQEPWALSAFIGSEMNFSREGEKRKGTNKGYMGYLVSYGGKHIKDNVLIDDDWWEFEWKLKGERVFAGENLSWSFFTGVKNHGHEDIADILYFGARRSSLDFKGEWLSWLQNSSFNWKLELTQSHFEFARLDAIIGKKFPMKGKGYALSLNFGVVYEKDVKYTGALTDPTSDNITFVFQPNIEF